MIITDSMLPIWTSVCKPVPKLLAEGIPDQEWAADFGELLDGRADEIYLDPVKFFDMTYVTENMHSIFSSILGALENGKGQRIIEIDTPFGGGKTHCIIALFHLIKNFNTLKDHPKVRDLYLDVGFAGDKEVKIATIVGTQLNPLGIVHEDTGITTYTIMGEIIHQLSPELYPRIQQNDERFVSVGTGVLGKLFAEIGPCIILIDELLEYISKAVSESGNSIDRIKSHMLTFLQELYTVVANSKTAVLVTTYPTGEQERDQIYSKAAQDVQMEMQQFISSRKEVQNRHQTTKLVAATDFDVANILKARLFEYVPSPEDDTVKEIANSFWTYYSLNKDWFPTHVSDPEYEDRLQQCYPFHPELIRILYGQWSTLPKFQKTRAFVKLMAEVVRYGYDAQNHEEDYPLITRALILPCAMDLGNAGINGVLLNCLEEDYKPVLEEDLARARSIDAHKGGRMQLERYAYAMTIATFLHSFTGATSQESPRAQVASRGAYPHDILLSVLAPRITVSQEQGDGDLPPIGQIQDMITVLTKGTESLYYLHCNMSRQYFFDIRTNLVAFADAQRKIIREVDVLSAVKEGIASIWPKPPASSHVKLVIFPDDPKDIPDTAEKPHIRFVLISPQVFTYSPIPRSQIEEDTKEELEDQGDAATKTTDQEGINFFALNATIGRGTTGTGSREYKKTVFFLVAEGGAWSNCLRTQRNERAWKLTVESPQYNEANQYEQQQGEANWKAAKDMMFSQLRVLFSRMFRVLEDGNFGFDDEFNLPHLLQQSHDQPFATVLDWLKKKQLIYSKLPPSVLANKFPAAWGQEENEISLATIWDRFTKDLNLPLLESEEILRICAEEGLRTGHFAIGLRKDESSAFTKILDADHVKAVSNFSESWLIRDITRIKLQCKSCKNETDASDLVDELCPNCQKVRCWRCGATVKRSESDESLGCIKCRDLEQCQTCGKFSKPEDILPEINKCVHCQEKVECKGCKQYRFEGDLKTVDGVECCSYCENWSPCPRCGKRISPEEYDQDENVIHYCTSCLQQTAKKCSNCGAKQELYNLRPIPEDGDWENATFTLCVKCENRSACIRCNKWVSSEDLHDGLCPICAMEDQMEDRVVSVEVSFTFSDLFVFQNQLGDLGIKVSQFPVMNSKGQAKITFEQKSDHPFPWTTKEEAIKAFSAGIPAFPQSKLEVGTVIVKKVPKQKQEEEPE